MMVCSTALINLARKMEERWGIPYFEGSFYGVSDTSDALRQLATLLVREGAEKSLLDRTEILIAEEEAFLPGLEAEAVAHLEKEILKTVEQGIFEVGLAHDIAGAQAEEFEDVGIADDLGGLKGFRLGVGNGGELGLVFRETAALVVEAGDLAAQLADGPVSPDALGLVEAALGFGRELDQFGKVCEGEAVDQLWGRCLHNLRFGIHCLPNWD